MRLSVIGALPGTASPQLSSLTRASKHRNTWQYRGISNMLSVTPCQQRLRLLVHDLKHSDLTRGKAQALRRA